MVLAVLPTGSRDRVRVLRRISRLNPDASGLELQKQPAGDWRSLVQTAGIGDKADFRLPADEFSLVYQWVHGVENIFFIAEKTYFLTETTVSVDETIVFAVEKMFSKAEIIFTVSETTSSALKRSFR